MSKVGSSPITVERNPWRENLAIPLLPVMLEYLASTLPLADQT